MKRKAVETELLKGIPSLCEFLGGIDKRICKKYFLDKGLVPKYSINDKLAYYDKRDVVLFLERNYKNKFYDLNEKLQKRLYGGTSTI